MKTKLSLLALTILTTGCATTTQQSSHWGYSGHEGPEYWGALDSKNSTCDTGVNQSPINLTGFINSDLPALDLVYKSGSHEILNLGMHFTPLATTCSMLDYPLKEKTTTYRS